MGEMRKVSEVSTVSTQRNRRGEPWYSCVCRIAMYHPAPPKTYLQIHMYHPFTSKASLFPAAKKIMVDTMYLFFGKNQVRVRLCAQSCAVRTFSSVLSELFLRVFCVFRALPAACKNLPLSYCHANATTAAVALPLPTPRRQGFHANATTAAVAAAPTPR